jgi:hypothetical protein
MCPMPHVACDAPTFETPTGSSARATGDAAVSSASSGLLLPDDHLACDPNAAPFGHDLAPMGNSHTPADGDPAAQDGNGGRARRAQAGRHGVPSGLESRTERPPHDVGHDAGWHEAGLLSRTERPHNSSLPMGARSVVDSTRASMRSLSGDDVVESFPGAVPRHGAWASATVPGEGSDSHDDGYDHLSQSDDGQRTAYFRGQQPVLPR